MEPDRLLQNQTNPPDGKVKYSQSLVATNLAFGLVAGSATASVFGMGGFFLINDTETGSMGAVLFLLLPFATGFATALIARRLNIIIASLIIGFMLCSAVLLATKMEGWVCVLMFTSVLVVDAPPDNVWNSIKTMDRVNAHKGFLMRIGLPVPVSCTLDKEAVGGTRTCYFESGFIEERVTEWDPPRSMKLEITAWDVPGRPWLDFKDAFHEENGRTVMTRTSTIVFAFITGLVLAEV